MKIIVIDFSWLLYRYHFGYKHIKNGHIVGMLNVSRMLQKQYDKVVFALDSKRSEFIDGYKAGRDHIDTSFKQDTMDIIKLLGCVQIGKLLYVKKEGYEADDLMYTIAKTVRGSIHIYSGDDDLLQCIDNNISIVREYKTDPDNSGFVELKEDFVKSKYGVDVKSIVTYRSLVGDKSDNIKGIYRMPKEYARQLSLQSNGDIETLFEVVKQEAPKKFLKYQNEVLINKEKLLSNYRLMKLNKVEDLKLNYIKPEIDKNLIAKHKLIFYLRGIGVNV